MSLWHTLDEEGQLLDDLVASGRVAVDVIGHSVQGRPIRLVRVGDPIPSATATAVLLLVGGQHGDEPAGREAILQLAEYLAGVQAVDVRLRQPGTAGNYTSTPDTAALDITGDLDLRVDLAPVQWAIGSIRNMISKYNPTGNQRSYTLRLSATGQLQMVWSANGTNLITRTCTEPIPAADGERIALCATVDVDDGASGNVTTFFTAPTIAGPWTQLGDPVIGTGTSSIFAGSANLEIGSTTDGTAALIEGDWFAAQVRSGIDGTVVADPDFTAQTPGATSFADSAGRTWTLAGTAELVDEGDPDAVSFIQNHGILMVPTLNPDGRLANSDRNANNINPNRDHIALTQPETRALAEMLRDTRPLVVMDLHESNGQISDATFLPSAQPQTHPDVAESAAELVTVLRARMTAEGWTSAPFNGGNEPWTLRQLTGLKHRFGVLIETSKVDDTAEGRAHRAEVHRTMVREAMTYIADHQDDLAAVSAAAAAAKTLEGQEGAAPFSVLSEVIDPPPLAYRLTASQQTVTAFHRDVFGISMTGDVMLMGQPAQPLIPFLVDPAAVSSVVSATQLFVLQDSTPPPAGLPEVAKAVIRTRIVWLGCDLVTGRRIAQLHDITGSVSRLIGAHTSASLTVPIPLDVTGRTPLATLLQATAPTATMIVAVVNDLPVWAGIPVVRERGTDASMSLGCVSIEGYLDRRYVGDHDLVDVDESVIFAALIGDANTEGIGLVVDAPPTGRRRERHYRGHDDATVYRRLQELSAVDGGPEWTIDLDWDTSEMRVVRKIARLRPRLGNAASKPPAVFRTTAGSVFSSTGGSETRYSLVEDFTDGRFARHIVAVGSGQGEDRAQSAPARDTTALAAGLPRWDMRIRPSTSITSVTRLGEHAAAELARRRNGAIIWRIAARWDAYPRYGVHWRLGDDIGWHLRGHGHPQGVQGQGRAIGVEIDPQAGTLAPILLDPSSIGG